MAEHGGGHEHVPTPSSEKKSAGSHSSEGGIIGGAGDLADKLLGGFVRDSVEPGPITSWLGAEGGGKGKSEKSSH